MQSILSIQAFELRKVSVFGERDYRVPSGAPILLLLSGVEGLLSLLARLAKSQTTPPRR